MKVNDLEREINRTRNTHDIDRFNTVLLCYRLTSVVIMKMTKWLYLREVRCCGCSTSTQPRALLTTESAPASLESILYRNIRSMNLLFSFVCIVLCFLSYVLKGESRTIFVKLSHGHFKVLRDYQSLDTDCVFPVLKLAIIQSQRLWSPDISAILSHQSD